CCLIICARYLLHLLLFLYCFILFFFFQAEDGIRDRNVTGVQTCALPIWRFNQLSLEKSIDNLESEAKKFIGLFKEGDFPEVLGGLGRSNSSSEVELRR